MDPVTLRNALSLGKVVRDMRESDRLNEQADRRIRKALNRVVDAHAEQKKTEELMEAAVLRLTNRKNAVLTSTMDDFLSLYEKIIKINFTETEGIKELGEFVPAVVGEMKMQINTIRNIPKTPTITKNVVIGYLIGGLAGAVSSSIVDDSQRALSQARIHAKQAEAVAIQAETIGLAYQGIIERVNRMTEVLTKLNYLFFKGIQESEQVIEANGTDKRNYSEQDRKVLAACINMAGAVKSILDTPIIDQEGGLTKKSLEVIARGETCLQEIDAAMFGN